MADQNTQQQQQQQRAPSRSPWDERLVICVMRIWKVEHDNAERVLSNLGSIMEAAQKEQDLVKREAILVSHGNVAWNFGFKLWQKNAALVRHLVALFQHITRAGGNFVPDVALDVAMNAFQRNANPLQMYPIALERHQQQLQPQSTDIADPEGITRVVSKDPTAHGDPGPVTFPALRPTLTGGVPLGIQNGMWRIFMLFVFPNCF